MQQTLDKEERNSVQSKWKECIINTKMEINETENKNRENKTKTWVLWKDRLN